jgi:predicted DNA-binding transcriptional regulator AlpA
MQMSESSTDPFDDLFDLAATCRFFGGSKPIHPTTLYRGIHAGIYPAPAKMGPNLNRWVVSECVAARNAMIASPRELRPLSDSHRASLRRRRDASTNAEVA